MSCPYLKTSFLAERDGVVAHYSCSMGKSNVDLPSYCNECLINPEGGFYE